MGCGCSSCNEVPLSGNEPLFKSGWFLVTMFEWSVVQVGDRREASRAVQGWVRGVGEKELGVSLVRDSRWALAVYKSPTDPQPFFIVPGCQVRGVQCFHDPVEPGFVTFTEPDQKWSYDFFAV